MKNYLLILLVSLIAGCAAAPQPHVELPEIAKSQSVTVRDERLSTEAKPQVLSYLITSDAYGIMRNGEMNIDPPVLRLLQHRVFEHSGADAKVTVYHFVTYQNMQPQLRGAGLGAVLGPIGAVIGSMAANAEADTTVTQVDRAAFDALTGDSEWKRGTYTATENPKKGAVYVTYVDIDVNGKRAFVRVVSPVTVPAGKVPYVESVESAIRAVLGQV